MSLPTSTNPVPITLVALDQLHEGPADTQRLERDPDRIRELAQSISTHGIIIPLLVRAIADGYETIAGGYRREAARVAGLHQVPCQIYECDDAEAWSLSTTENLQRHNLSPLEEAEIVRISTVDHGMTIDQIAHSHGRTTTWVQDRLDLLTWDPAILAALHDGTISKAAAAPLATVSNQILRQALLVEAIRYGATARITGNWVRTAKLQNQHADGTDAEQITKAPTAEPPRVVGNCWICRNDLDIAHMSHLPTCPNCIELVRHGGPHGPATVQADNPITAPSHSSAVTPA